MPEGPEIRRAADRIERALEGKIIEEVRFGLAHLEHWEPELFGRKLEKIETYGKAMVTHLEGDQCIYSHNQLYGRWVVRRRGSKAYRTNRSERLVLRSATHEAILYSASQLEVLAKDELLEHPFIQKLGPDALDDSVESHQILERLTSKRFSGRQLATTLLDQAFVAGLGNYLRSEILFLSGLYPTLRPKDLTSAQLELLAAQILLTTRRAYATGGVTTSDEVVSDCKQRRLPRRAYRHYVFARAKRECHLCDGRIERLEIGGRRIYICPEHQPEP